MGELPPLESLTVVERIKLVQDLWDEIAAAPSEVPVTQAQRNELDRRLADCRTNPDEGDDWRTVKLRLKK